MRFEIAARTDTGRVRNQNEDSMLAELPLVAVADGMGGHRGGEVASAAALEVLKGWRDKLPGARPIEVLRDAFVEANRVVWEKGREDERLEGMGTTLTAALVEGRKLTLGHVGDSRAYLLRSGSLSQVTEDQTLVREWEKQGRLTADEAAHSPQRNILLQAIGGDPGTLQVDVTTVDLRPGDRLLLASDGLHSMVADPDRLRDIMLANDDPDDACRALIDAANDAGGHDNITVIVVDAFDGDGAGNGAPLPAEPDVTGEQPPIDPEKTGEQAAVIVTRHAPPEPAKAKAAAPRSRSRRTIGIAIAAVGLAALIAGFFVLRAANTRLLVSARDGRVVVVDGRAGAQGRPATGRVVRSFPDRLDTFPGFTQRTLRTGIPVNSLSEAERVVAGLPRVLGPEQTPAPTPATSASPAAPPLQTLPPPGSVP
jgi:PPM family protein phosphatase